LKSAILHTTEITSREQEKMLMPQIQTTTYSRNRILAFRLSQSEYQILASAAKFEKRKMADLVHVIVTDALERYTQRQAEPDLQRSNSES
jgi:hypothetical protein